MTHLSFIIAVYNHQAETETMLASLIKWMPAGLDYEIIMIDDCSTDGTGAWLETLNLDRLRLIKNGINIGYARSNNFAAASAKGQVIAFLNNDLVLTDGWLTPMLEKLLSSQQVGIVGNVQFRVADQKIDHAGIILNPLAQFFHSHQIPEDTTSASQVLAVTGACFLIRKSDFDDVGGFDEGYLNGCEDVDLCFKMQKRHKQIHISYQSRIFHHVSLTRSVTSQQNEINSRLLFQRWRSKIKALLTDTWAMMIQRNDYREYLDGSINEKYLKTPQVSARIIAESMILRQEFRWMRDIDQRDPNQDIAQKCRFSGLKAIHQPACYLIQGAVLVDAHDVQNIRNFHVCGWVIPDKMQGQVRVNISVNGIHEISARHDLTMRSFNIGIREPILVAGALNRFRIEFRLLNENLTDAGDASHLFAITHIVMDDKELRQLS